MVSVSGEGEDDYREQEQKTEREGRDCEQTVRVYSVGEHHLPPCLPMMAGPAPAAGYQRKSGSSLSSRGGLGVVGKPLMGFCNEPIWRFASASVIA